jgi:hypothetical protein
MKFLVACNLPLTLVDEQGFKKLVAFFDPRSEVKTSNEMSETECPVLYNNIKVMIVLSFSLSVCLSLSFYFFHSFFYFQYINSLGVVEMRV